MVQGFTPLPNLTQVQTLHKANLGRKAIAPNSYFNRMLLEKDPQGAFKEVPKELRSQWKLFSSPPGIDSFMERLRHHGIQGDLDTDSPRKIDKMRGGEAFYLKMGGADFFIMMKGGELILFRVTNDVVFSPFQTGTLALVAKKGRAFGPSMSKEFTHNGCKKTLTYRFDREHAPLVNTMLRCDHGFAPDGTPLIQLVDKHKQPIIKLAEVLYKYDEIFLNISGKIDSFKIEGRDGGLFESFEGENTYIWISDGPAIAFLARGYSGFLDCFNEWRVPNHNGNGASKYITVKDGNRRNVQLVDCLDLARGALFLENGKQN